MPLETRSGLRYLRTMQTITLPRPDDWHLHLRDGAALAKFLAWIDREALSGKLTEIDAVEALETFRRETGALKDVSFPTISGAGPNGAIVHYRVSRSTSRVLGDGEAFRAAAPRDGEPDMRPLLVGSEGTFGVITELTLRLVPKPPMRWTRAQKQAP